MSQISFYSHGLQNTAERFDNVTLPTFQCNDWTHDQVLSWLKGIDDCILPYLRVFRKGDIDGKVLLLLDDADLFNRGITSSYVREKILHAIKLLQYYTYSIHNENLQKLAMLVVVDINNLIQSISKANPVIEQFNNGSDQLAGQRLTRVLNSVLMSFSVVYEHVKKLVFWLDRAPFEHQKEYIQLRDKITELILEMLDSVNPQNRRFIPVSEVLHDRGLQLQKICQQLVFNTDPAILYVPYFATAYIRKTDYSFGINFQSVFNGINLITSIDPDSPASRCKKLNAGDEIVDINGEIVVGWHPDKVKKKLNYSAPELKLMISRRPRDEGTSNGLSKSKTSETLLAEDDDESRHKLELDFSLKIEPDMFSSREGSRRLLHRRRSSSFSFIGDSSKKNSNRLSMPVFNSSTIIASRSVGNDRKLYRRASVWSDSPPASFTAASRKIQNGLESKALMHLLDCWTEPKARNNGHLRLVRPSRLVKATELTNGSNTVMEEDEEAALFEEKADKIDYTNVDIVLPTEAEKLKLSSPSVNDPEWNAPVQEITGLRLIRRIHLESTSSAIPDSPLSAAFNKISRFWSGDTASSSAMSTSFTSDKTDASVPSTPINKSANALEKIVKEKTRQTIPLSVTPNGLPIAKSLTTSTSSEATSSSIMSPRYSTVKSKQNLAPLAEPEKDDDDDDESMIKEINSNFDLTAEMDCIDEYIKIPCRQLENKSFEGWIRRQRLCSDPIYIKQKKLSQWIKAWVVLVNNRILLSFSSQFAKNSDLALDLHKCNFKTNSADIKTSKRFVFCLSSGKAWYHFAPYTQQEFTSWTKKIIPNIQKQKISDSKDVTTNNNLERNDISILSPIAANTLPRTSCSKKKEINRKGSLNRAFTPFSDIISHSSVSNSVDDLEALNTVR